MLMKKYTFGESVLRIQVSMRLDVDGEKGSYQDGMYTYVERSNLAVVMLRSGSCQGGLVGSNSFHERVLLGAVEMQRGMRERVGS